MIISGIYMLKNIRTLKVYIGSSVDLRARMYEHIRQLERGTHPNTYLQRVFNKKQDDLVFCTIEFVKCKEDLIDREQYWLDFYKSYERGHGYNMCHFAGNTLGRRPSAETRQKMSAKQKGTRNGMYGKTHTPQVKEKLARLRRESEVTPEFRLKMSEVTTGKKNGMYGKQHSEEAKRRISESKKGVPSKIAKIPRADYLTIKSDVESKKRTVRQIATHYGVQTPAIYKVLRAVR